MAAEAPSGKRGGLRARILLLCLMVAAVVAIWMMELDHYLSLDYLKQSRQSFEAYYAANKTVVMAAYFAMYVIVTALSIPGAAVMTLAGGAVFGLLRGTVVVSFASSIGATLAFLASRYVLRDAVQSRFGQRLEAINRGIEAEGAFYLFTLRLVPVFPFFVINLLMGLTRMRTWTFYWVSQLGMLAGTIVYVNAGRELGKLASLKGILSPGLLASFVILGFFPITARKLIAAYRKGRALPPAGEGRDGT